MILDLELDGSIYERLESLATERGISVKELIRWVIGDYVRYSNISTAMPASPPILRVIPSSHKEQENDSLMKFSKLMMKDMLDHGAVKCPDCSLSLKVDDVEQGKCSNCGAEI